MSLTDEECSICLEKLENEIAHLTCNHFFHYRCIGEWINNNIKNKKKTYCPICNQEFEILNIYLPKHINTKNINKFTVKYNQTNNTNINTTYKKTCVIL